MLWYGGGVVSWKYLSAWHAHVNEVDLGQADKISQTDFATFCASLIPRDVFKITGFLDEKYFLYFEDTDYSLRAQKKGIPTVYLPETHLWHDNAGSSGGSGSALQKYYQERNIVRFMLKHAPMRFKITTIRKLIQMLFSKDAVIREAGWDACLMRYHARKEKK